MRYARNSTLVRRSSYGTSLPFEIAGGNLMLWLDEAGSISLKVREQMRLTVEPSGT
jgi:hypothetical protein